MHPAEPTTRATKTPLQRALARRAWVGFAIAPITTPVLLEVLRQFGWVVGGIETAPLSYFWSWVLGVPAFALYARLGILGLPAYLAGGVCGLSLVCLGFTLLFREYEEPWFTIPGMFGDALMFGGFTVPVVVTFWLIVVRPVTRAHAKRSSETQP